VKGDLRCGFFLVLGLLTRIFGRKVDLGVFSSLSPYVIEDVKKEMQVIYEKR